MRYTERFNLNEIINLFDIFRMSKFVASKANAPLGALITAEALSPKTSVSVSWGQETCFTSTQGSVLSTTSSGTARCVTCI